MTDISKHPLLKQAYDVCLAIEACGASIELTNAVTKASTLLQDLGKFIDTVPVPLLAPALLSETKINQAVSVAHAVANLASDLDGFSSSAQAHDAVEALIKRLSEVAIGIVADRAPDAPAIIPATSGAEVIVHIETTPGLTVEKLEDLATLEAYFVRAAALGVIDFTVRCTHHQEGEGAHFYIHPANISGETLQFVVAENTLRNV